jgi:hypothetical protein
VRPRRFITFLLVAGLLCGAAPLSTGCGPKLPPNATPPMAVAKYGGDAMATIHQIQLVTVGLVETKVIPLDAGATVMAASIKIGETGIALSGQLTEWQTAIAAADKNRIAVLIAQSLAKLNAFLATLPGMVGKTISDARYGQAIADLLVAITNIRLSIPGIPTVVVPQGEV